MGNPAINKVTNPLAIEGLEELLLGQDRSGQVKDTHRDSPGQLTTKAQDSSPQVTAPPLDSPGQDNNSAWTVEEAAKNLGVSVKTILRRLQKGSLSS